MNDEILEFQFPRKTQTIIKVIGVGGGGGNAVKYVAHFRFSDGVHIPARQQHKFRVAKKPAGAE